MAKATFLGKIDHVRGDTRHYRLDPPMQYTDYDYSSGDEVEVTRTAEYVIVSGVVVLLSGPETYIFPADEDDITDWGELDGSFRGYVDHAEALRRAGYEEIIDEADD